MAARTATLGALFLVVLLDLLGFGILIPQLGVYALKFQASPFSAGLLLSIYSLMQLVFAPLLGRLSDRYGRRPILLYSIAGSVAGYVLFGFAGSLAMLFAARIVDGISGGNISTAQAYIADITTPATRAKGMGMIGAAFGLGFILGPGIGGLLGAWGGNFAIGMASAGLAAVNWVLAFLFLPETRRESASAGDPRSVKALAAGLTLPVVGLGLLVMGIFTTAFSQMEGTFSLFVLNRHLGVTLAFTRSLFTVLPDATGPVFQEASLKVGWVFVAVGVVSSVIQGGLIGRLKTRFGEPTLVWAGVAIAGAGLGSLPLAPSYAWLFAPAALLALGSGLFNPSLSALVSMHAPEGRQGATLGAYQAAGALGRVVGPAVGGLLFTLEGANAPYWVAAGMMGVGLLLALRLAGQVRAKRAPLAVDTP